MPIPDEGTLITSPLLAFNSGRARLKQFDVTPEWVARNIRATDVEYVVVTYSGHWIWVDQPELFMGALEPFLLRHRPSQ